MKTDMAKVKVRDKEIAVVAIGENDYVSITDIAKYKSTANADDVVKNWMRNRNTIELLGLWETIHNPDFKPVEFDGFRKEAGLNSFVLTP
jgi:hypothetical protein